MAASPKGAARDAMAEADAAAAAAAAEGGFEGKAGKL